MVDFQAYRLYEMKKNCLLRERRKLTRDESVSLCDRLRPENAVKVFQMLDECDSSHDKISHETKVHSPSD